MKTDMMCSWLDRNLSKIFAKVGHNVGLYPGYYVVIPVLVGIIFATGLQRLHYEDDPEYLFSPTDGRSKHERHTIDTLFPMNYTRNFNLGRITHKGRFGRLIVVANDESNVLTRQVFNEVMQLDGLVKNMTITWDDNEYRYADLCAMSEGKCWENDVLDFHTKIDDIEGRKFFLKYPIWINQDIYKVYFFPAHLGGVVTDANGLVDYAKAINLMYFLDVTKKKGDERAAMWEDKFLIEVEKFQFKHINVARFVSTTLRTELESNTQSLVPFFSITVIIMLVFSVTTCMMSDWVRSKPWLGLLGCVSAGIGVLASFGICVYAGVDMIGINLAAPFLMLGVGMDDAFVLLASWRRTRPELSIPERLSATYSEAAVSITITSLTNFISFMIGTYTPFPSVRIFCIYTAVAVLSTYVYHITFFGGCMAFFGRAEKNNLHGLTCMPVMPKSMSHDKSFMFRLLCTGGRNEMDPDNKEDNEEHMMMLFFRDTLAKSLNKTSVKILVILIFLVYLGIGIYGCTQVKEGLDRRKLSRDDSYSVRYYDYEDRFFREYPYRVQVVVNDTLNYADPEDQGKVESMLQKFESSEYVANRSMTESWLRAYLEFLKQEDSFLFLQALNISDKEDFYRGLRDVFLKFPMTEAFRHDIVFNEDGTEIIASRYVIQTHNIEDANMEKEMLISLRRIANEMDLNVTIFHQLFIFFDQFILVRDISLQTITVAAIVMMVISLLFIPSPSCAIWVAFSIISIEVGVIGYMTLWNVNLDSISMINLIMCIGFSVDFSAHISYAYISCEETTAADRVSSALYSLGLPIFQGSVSTILGIIALAFAPSYVFLVFFKTVFLVMLFGATHGVLLLPVLLSITDVCRGSDKKKRKAIKDGHDGEDGPHDGRTGTYTSSMHHPRHLHHLHPPTDHLSLSTAVAHPFLISEKSLDGKTISRSINPIFIPRVSMANIADCDHGKGKAKCTTADDSDVPKVVDEDSGQGSKSSASSETGSGTREKDYGLGTSGEECSEGSWKVKKEGDDVPVVVESEAQVPTVANTNTNGCSIHHRSSTRNAGSKSDPQRHLYTKWPSSGVGVGGKRPNGDYREDHINFGYISDSGDQDCYDVPLPQLNLPSQRTGNGLYPGANFSSSSPSTTSPPSKNDHFSRGTSNSNSNNNNSNNGRLSAYDVIGSNRIGGWSGQLIGPTISNPHANKHTIRVEGGDYGLTTSNNSGERNQRLHSSNSTTATTAFYQQHHGGGGGGEKGGSYRKHESVRSSSKKGDDKNSRYKDRTSKSSSNNKSSNNNSGDNVPTSDQ
ncbi:patched domain-containing protein [Brevipalpus obovatus]|uniref:patched domain-containing protein n=1 Tax=Brevipalpus obovatus TaxID=246614 RepID=UPI003D9F28C7